ncbi:hypothetical protein OGAPHI_004858 [Ogataea philodendri]|uniref:Amine oxidase n=1 Tax=Ogataea philodendri TaxID=1378263 RepID=A0A9P8T3F9_9ASCO|nr:uncharacterized protein OGAPHI_004858 [Ogataea philodendri]KAH3664144.1 hypothetical protein OGAPHI_004858 [Ogataea philodendri]
MAAHPFDPISDAEIRLTSKLIKNSYGKDQRIRFSQIDRQDPPKQDMLRYLEAEKAGKTLPQISRITYAFYYVGKDFYKALVNATYGHLITTQKQGKGVVGPMIGDDVAALEHLLTIHPIVQAEVKKLNLPPHIKVVCDPWIYGTDDDNEDRLLVQCYMYLANANHPESNHYSLPLKFSPVFESLTNEFVRMDYLPAGTDATSLQDTEPWTDFSLVEYHPDLNGEPLRPLKPLVVQQPEGPSFNVDGHKITWQGWEFTVVPNSREGFAIYDIHFKGRSVIYRLSLSEMTVPYGDPRAPYHRKQAFDLGDAGFGATGNSLKLGCDCLGVIKYFDCTITDSKGEPRLIPSTVCLHEQDGGLLYKHMNYRTGSAVTARRREFVVQTIATVANYEYLLNIIFDQAGEVRIHVRATGILSTMPIEKDKTVNWGTNVGPLVMAAYHQHLLSFRIDPAVDGYNNTVVYDDVERMPTGTDFNPYNVGFFTKRTVVDKPGYVEQSPFTNRSYKIINENVINQTTKRPVGYKILMPARQMLLADDDSFNAKRAHFATQQLWVTKYQDNELYAAGEFTNQSHVDTGLKEWAYRKENVRNSNPVVWATLGFTHIPRAEDFPVMPVETHEIGIVPHDFFEKNPALDVPQSTQSFNKSAYYPDSSKSDSCCKTAL